MTRSFKALADETRLRIVALLAGREQSVEEIAAALSLRLPSVSHHLQRLRDLTLVEMRAEGTTHYYVLRWLAEHFSFGQRHPESDVNEILGRHHPDFATLQRELIGNGLMQREGSVYWRLPPSPEEI